MPNNDFLAFATGAGANVENQATFASDPSTSAGFSAGIAQSQKLNKVWRQSSFVSAGLAQFIVNALGIDVLDDANLVGFTQNLTNALLSLNPRTVLHANTQYWVNSVTGSDNNPGTSTAQAWQTLQHAATWVSEKLDLNGYVVTINIADGVYAGFHFLTPILGVADPNSVTFTGNLSNPAGVVVQNDPAYNMCVTVANGAMMLIQGVRFSNPSGGGIQSNSFGRVRFAFCDFAACTGDHLTAAFHAHIRVYNSYSISGGAPNHYHCSAIGTILGPGAAGSSTVVTLTGTPAFSGTFCRASGNSMAAINTQEETGGTPVTPMSFVGTATGEKFLANTGGVINASGQGINWLPGSVAGVADATTYGVYVP